MNRPAILRDNLAASPVFAEIPSKLMVQPHPPSAGIAYNKALQEAKCRIVVFAHQDVYLPLNWDRALAHQVHALDQFDPNWAVAGVFGIEAGTGRHCGHVWSTGLGCELGENFADPIRASCLDELLLIVNRASGVMFDPDLPSFHLFGTDIVQQANCVGRTAYIVHLPVVHNSRRVVSLSGGYTDAYTYMQEKWLEVLPLKTLIADVTQSGLPLMRMKMRLLRRSSIRRAQTLFGFHENLEMTPRDTSPQRIANELGFEMGGQHV